MSTNSSCACGPWSKDVLWAEPRTSNVLGAALPVETHLQGARRRDTQVHTTHASFAYILGDNIKALPPAHSGYPTHRPSPRAQEPAPSMGSDTASDGVCVKSPWEHLASWAGCQMMSLYTLDLKYSDVEKSFKALDPVNNVTRVFLAGQMYFCRTSTRCPSCPVFGHCCWLLFIDLFSTCPSRCSACVQASFWSIPKKHKAWSYKGNLTSAADACPFVDPLIPPGPSGPWKVEWKINHWHQNKCSRGGARSKASWKMWAVIKDVQWVTFS